MYLHLYYNAEKAVEDGRKFNLLLSNEVKTSRMALEIYRNKDVVEKAFGNIKERLKGSSYSRSEKYLLYYFANKKNVRSFANN